MTKPLKKCPRDGTALLAVQIQSIELDKCHRCDGIWLDQGELQRLRELKVASIEQTIDKQLGQRELEAALPDGYMRCPACPGRLQKVPFVGRLAVEVDRCDTCRGMWLDDGELDQTTQVRRTAEQSVSSGRLSSIVRSLAGFFE